MCWKPRAKFSFKQSELPKHLIKRERNEDYRGFNRQGENVVGRISLVSLKEGELYYLLALLHYTPRTASIPDMKTIDDEDYLSYRKACSHRGLLSDDAE